jgi:hypothetical protein
MNLGFIGAKIAGASTAVKTAMIVTGIILVEVGTITVVKLVNQSPAPASATVTEAPLQQNPAGPVSMAPNSGSNNDTAEKSVVPKETTATREREAVEAQEQEDSQRQTDVESDFDKNSELKTIAKKSVLIPERAIIRSPYQPGQ